MKLTPLLTLVLLSLGLPAVAAEPPSVPARQENRFLFVVDTSYSMARLDQASGEVLFELIYSGLHLQMKPGDTFSIWTFNTKPHMDKYPLQVWNPRKNLELAGAAAKFIRAQSFQGRDRLDVLLRDLFLVIGDVRDLNILLLSDGGTPMSGTPFDAEISRVYKSNVAKVRSAKKPFVTTLVARGGQLTHWSVTIGDQYFKLPGSPEEEPVPPSIAQVSTNPAPAPVTSRPPETVAQTNQLSASPSQVQNLAKAEPGPVENPAGVSPPGPGQQPTTVTVATLPPAPTNAPTNPTQAKPLPPPPTPPTTTAAAPTTPTTSPPAPTAPAPTAPTTNGRSGIESLPAQTRADPLTVVAREPTRADSKPTGVTRSASPTMAVAVAEHSENPRNLLLTGAALLLVAVGLGGWAFRRFRSPPSPSLISRSIQGR